MSTKVTLQMPEQAARLLRDPRRLAHFNALLQRAGMPRVERVDVEREDRSTLPEGTVVASFEVGQRINLAQEMIGDPYPLPVGATGKISGVKLCGHFVQYDIAWDSPNERRSLYAICPPDVLELIPNTETHDAPSKHDAGPAS